MSGTSIRLKNLNVLPENIRGDLDNISKIRSEYERLLKFELFVEKL